MKRRAGFEGAWTQPPVCWTLPQNGKSVPPRVEKCSLRFPAPLQKGNKPNLQCDHLSRIITLALEPLPSSKYYCSLELGTICGFGILLTPIKWEKSCKAEKRGALRRCGGCFPLPLLMNAEVICLSEEESGGEAWFPPHFIWAPQPLSASVLLSHAGVPQETTLHEGQRSGKDHSPLN